MVLHINFSIATKNKTTYEYDTCLGEEEQKICFLGASSAALVAKYAYGFDKRLTREGRIFSLEKMIEKISRLCRPLHKELIHSTSVYR